MERIILLLVGITSYLFSHGKNITFINHPDSTYNITTTVEYYCDSTNAVNIEDLLKNSSSHEFTENGKDIFHHGNTPNTYWVKFDVVNHLHHEVLVYLSAEWLNLVEFYEIRSNEIIRYREMGAALNRNDRALAISKPAVLIPFTDGLTHTIYLKFKTDHALTTTISIATMKEVYKHFVKESVIYNIFLGIIVLIFFYNLYLAIITRRTQYIMFSFYILFLVLSISYVKGFHTFFHSVYFTKHNNIFTGLMVIFLVFSMTSMTEIQKLSPTIYKLRFAVIIVPSISILINIFGSVRIANQLIDLGALLGIIWSIALAIVILKHGGDYAKNLIIAFAAFLVGGAVQILLGYGVFKVNFWTTNAYVIGSGLEVIFLSSALAIKINQFRKDRYLAQKEKINEIRKNELFIKEQNELLEDKVKRRTQALEQTNKDLELTLGYVQEQKDTIEQNNQYIIDGIKYAKTIQDAILIPPSELDSLLPNSFILFKPKDILSGDFYWFGDRGDEIIIAVVDCEGHGVSGAMLSMMGYAFMNEIVYDEGISVPGKILDKLNAKVVNQLFHTEKSQCDTMDVAVVSVNRKTKEVLFAGARNPLIIHSDEDVQVIKGDRLSVGEKHTINKAPYTTHHIEADSSQRFFISSDGYQDQFGGPHDKKMMGKIFRSILKDTCSSTTAQDKAALLDDFLKEWQQDNPQTDDILVIGFEV